MGNKIIPNRLAVDLPTAVITSSRAGRTICCAATTLTVGKCPPQRIPSTCVQCRVNGLLKYDHDCSGKDGNLFVWQLTVFDHVWKNVHFTLFYILIKREFCFLFP